MQWRNLAVFIGLGLLAISQCSEGRHSMRDRRDTEYVDDFAAGENSDDEPQNDELNDAEGATAEPKIQPPEIPAKIITLPKVYEVKIGDNVMLECDVDPENGTVVHWYKGADLIFVNKMKLLTDQPPRYNVAAESKNLYIKDVQPSDTAVFKCNLVQHTPMSIEHTLVVLEPPKVISFAATNDGKVQEGQDLLLTCATSGIPPPQIIWSRTLVNDDTNERLSESDGDFSHNSLRMRDVKREHSGNYYCYVHNGLGWDQKELLVRVAGKPRVHVHKAVINIDLNVEAVLECATHSDDNPQIRWYKDGKLIENGNTRYVISTIGNESNLTVVPSEAEDFATFTCEAENEVGRHNRSIELVQRPVVEGLRSEGGRLSFVVHSYRPLQRLYAQTKPVAADSEKWAEFDIPIPSNAKHSFEVTFELNDKGLGAGKYEAGVHAINDVGSSDPVDLVILEIDIQPSMSIQTASVIGGGSNAHSIRPSSVIPSILLMYLLVRTL